MTKPVEGWIRRAAARCTSMGFTQLGRELALHASAEADHHLLMIADLRSLAARWNASYAPPVDADALLGQLPSAGVVKYCKLHEECIASESPFAQAAAQPVLCILDNIDPLAKLAGASHSPSPTKGVLSDALLARVLDRIESASPIMPAVE